MNILYLCDEYPPCKHGGIGSVTQTLARELVRKGHEVSVCGFYPYFRTALPFEDDFGVKVFRRFYGSWPTLQLSRRRFFGDFVNIEASFRSYADFLLRMVHENKVDLIEMPEFNEAFRYSGPRFITFPDFDVPVVVKLHGSYTVINDLTRGTRDTTKVYEKERSLIQRATKAIAVSHFTKAKVQEAFSLTRDIEVIYNGIPIMYRGGYKRDLRDTVVYAGRFCESKGVFSLIRSWEKVVSHVPSARLLLFGRGGKRDIGTMKELLTEKIKRSVEINGFVNREQLAKIYSSASCAIFPSYTENFSMAPMEAMAIGCPTIFTKRSSGPELIDNEVNGLTVDPDDTDDIAEAIILMLTNRERADEMGKNGARTIREKFNISNIADQHVRLYESIAL